MADPARCRERPVTKRAVEDLLRELAPQVLGTLVRRYGHFDACEDATQEALLRAATHWPTEGIPDNPRGWLVTVASHRLLDEFRSDQSRRRREDAVMAATPQSELLGRPADAEPGADRDDSLMLLFLCCHPALSAPSQISLTLRAVGGLTTTQIAAAFLVPEATMAQRISRAKRTIQTSKIPFTIPQEPERVERLRAVLHVLYLIFNEGYTATIGSDLTAPQLSNEAIRLTRWLRRLLPDDAEIAGLLALMLLTDARRPARIGADGSLVPLSPSPWCTGRPPGSNCSHSFSPTSGWRPTTACTPPMHTCWNWPVPIPPQQPPTARPPYAPPASPNADTSPPAPRDSPTRTPPRTPAIGNLGANCDCPSWLWRLRPSDKAGFNDEFTSVVMRDSRSCSLAGDAAQLRFAAVGQRCAAGGHRALGRSLGYEHYGDRLPQADPAGHHRGRQRYGRHLQGPGCGRASACRPVVRKRTEGCQNGHPSGLVTHLGVLGDQSS
jgi:RNA polymerase sigma factor (sigma-70 family)